MQQGIVQLASLGTFPSYSDNVTEEKITEYETAIESISRPVNNEEATVLCKLLGQDDFYGLAWSIVHLVESAPNWPTTEAIDLAPLTWQETLKQRVENSLGKTSADQR